MTPFARDVLLATLGCLPFNIVATHLIARQVWRESETKSLSQRKPFVLAMLPNIHLPPLGIRIAGDDAPEAHLARRLATAAAGASITVAIIAIVVLSAIRWREPE